MNLQTVVVPADFPDPLVSKMIVDQYQTILSLCHALPDSVYTS